MFVRNGHAVGSILHRDLPTAKRRSSADAPKSDHPEPPVATPPEPKSESESAKEPPTKAASPKAPAAKETRS